MFTMNIILETIILILILISVALLQINVLYALYCVIIIMGLVVIDIYNWIRELEDKK